MSLSTTSSPTAKPRVVPYDFRQPMTLPREHARSLEVAGDRFARHWSTQLVARLRVGAQVSLDEVQMCTYDEYVSSLPSMTTLLIATIDGGRRSTVLEFPVSTALDWIERMLGGAGTSGTALPVPERALTELEQQLLRRLMDRVLADLGYSLAGIFPVKPEFKGMQYSPQVMQVSTATAPVLVARLTIEVEGTSVPASVMLPAEEILTALRETQGVDNRTAEELEAERIERERLDSAVQEVPVDVAVRFRPIQVQPRRLVELKVGDVLPLNQPASQPLDVVVGDKVLAQAAAGTSGSRLAGLIVNVKENS